MCSAQEERSERLSGSCSDGFLRPHRKVKSPKVIEGKVYQWPPCPPEVQPKDYFLQANSNGCSRWGSGHCSHLRLTCRPGNVCSFTICPIIGKLRQETQEPSQGHTRPESESHRNQVRVTQAMGGTSFLSTATSPAPHLGHLTLCLWSRGSFDS